MVRIRFFLYISNGIKEMKRLILIFILLTASYRMTGEEEVSKAEHFVIGRFAITNTDKGYRAFNLEENRHSHYHDRVINAINEIR